MECMLYVRRKRTCNATCLLENEFAHWHASSLAVLLAGVLLLPTAATLLHGRDATHAAVDWFTLLFPIPNVHYFVYSPFSIGGTFFRFSIFILLDAKRHEIRFLSITFLILLCVPFVLYLMNGTMYLDAKAYIPFLPLVLLLMGAVLRAVLQEKFQNGGVWCACFC